MRPPRPARTLCALVLAVGGSLALGASARAEDAPEKAAAPTIYKWVDTNGIAHYTTDLGRVPRSVRGSVRALGTPSPSEGFAARDAGTPSAPAAPGAAPAEAAPEWDQGSAAAAPAPAPAPVGRERWAESDRPAELPGEEVAATSAAPQAAAEPSEPPAPSPEVVAGQVRDLDQRIAALEVEIASYEETLKGFLAAPAPGDPGEIAYDRSFREVAERLPKRLAELRTLQSERAQLDQP
jgi:hypothetical protein